MHCLEVQVKGCPSVLQLVQILRYKYLVVRLSIDLIPNNIWPFWCFLSFGGGFVVTIGLEIQTCLGPECQAVLLHAGLNVVVRGRIEIAFIKEIISARRQLQALHPIFGKDRKVTDDMVAHRLTYYSSWIYWLRPFPPAHITGFKAKKRDILP